MFGKLFKKRRKHLITNRIKQNNLIASDKGKHLKGKIILTHCRGHDTILIFFYLKAFTSSTLFTSNKFWL